MHIIFLHLGLRLSDVNSASVIKQDPDAAHPDDLVLYVLSERGEGWQQFVNLHTQ